MRLTCLSLTRYGNFAAEKITFDPRPGAVNLLLAPNGAGKSVLRSAFCDLLFGIGAQTPMGFRFGYPGMRITAEALGPDGAPFAFGRRKGQGNTLVDADGNTLDATAISRVLGRTDRTTLERLFALDTDRLRLGEEELFASNGALADALESGAGGFHQARRLRKGLEDTRDSLAPMRRSSQRPFYKALDQFVEARRHMSAAVLRPEQWQKQQQELAASEQRQREENAVAETASAEIARLERIRRVIPWLAAYDTALAWLAGHPDAPVLDPALAVRLADTRSAIVLSEHRARRDAESATRLAEQLADIAADPAVLAEAEEIDSLVEGAGAARKAATDLPTVSAQAASRQSEVAARLRDLGSALAVDQAAAAIPPRAAANRVRRLINAHGALQAAVQTAPARIDALAREREAAVTQLDAVASGADQSEPEALVKEIRAEGDPAHTARVSAAALTDASEALTAALSRVPGWDKGADALLALSPLLPDHYQRMADERGGAQTETDRRLEALQAARQVRDEASARLANLTKAGALPDDAVLTHAREWRDIGWQLIFRRAFTPDPPTPAEEQAFTGPLPLPIAFERSVSSADDVADRRVQEAAAIERVQGAQAALHEAEARVQATESAHRIADERLQATDRQWRQVCSALPLGEAPVPRELLAFLSARDRALEARARRVAAEAADRTLAARHAEWAARLAALLDQPSLGLSLPSLLAAADKRLAEAQRAAKAHAAAEARRDAADKALEEARARHREATAALGAWQADWAPAMQELGRPADTDPQRINDELEIINDLDKAQKEVASLGERIDGMNRDISRFTEAATALACRVAPELEATDPFAVATDLRRRLQHAREQAKQRDLVAQQLQAAKDAAGTAARDLADRQAAQRAVLSLIGADDIEAAESRLALAAERARHAATLAAAQVKLREAGDLLPLTQLRDEVAAVPTAEIPARVEHAVQRRQAAQAAAQDAAAAASALRQQNQQTEDDTKARDANADQAAAVATIGRVLEEALVHHLAAGMLDMSLAAVERDSDTALLRRISALFERLTGGTYARVLTETDDAGPPRLVLLQRAYPEERQSVRELSEGTRDQLYLALRLAAIEEHAASAPPLPFIGDDILQTFDDDRALAAMEVLREVSATVQVILLTHHRHVLDLARRLPAGSVHVCRIGAEAEALAG